MGVSPAAEHLLRELADGRFHSGAVLAEQLGITRAAVWKHAESLRALQIPIQAVSGRGYRLSESVELLNAERITSGLSSLGLSDALTVEVALSCPSTNSALLERSRFGAGAQALLAETQTAGRGRWGRQWLSNFGGGLYLSLLWRFPLVPAGLTGLSLACAVVVAETLQAAGAHGIGLKWPNDIVCEEGKLGGILIELVGEPSGPCAAVIGLGLNLRVGQEQRRLVEQPVADLYQFIGENSLRRNELATRLITALVRVCQGFPVDGLKPYQTRWAACDSLAGQRVVLSLPDGPIEGTAIGIDGRGALRLQTKAGTESYFSGDLQLRVRHDTTDRPR